MKTASKDSRGSIDNSDGIKVLAVAAVVMGGFLLLASQSSSNESKSSDGFLYKLIQVANVLNESSEYPSDKPSTSSNSKLSEQKNSNFNEKMDKTSTTAFKNAEEIVYINGKKVAISKSTKYSNRTEWTVTSESGHNETLKFYPDSYSNKKFSIRLSNFYTRDEALKNFVNTNK